jgi:hypothetical protein
MFTLRFRVWRLSLETSLPNPTASISRRERIRIHKLSALRHTVQNMMGFAITYGDGQATV